MGVILLMLSLLQSPPKPRVVFQPPAQIQNSGRAKSEPSLHDHGEKLSVFSNHCSLQILQCKKKTHFAEGDQFIGSLGEPHLVVQQIHIMGAPNLS